MNRLLLRWFTARGWKPFDFQRQTWQAYRGGGSGLVHAPTGTGKTYAVWLGPLAEMVAECGGRRRKAPAGLRVLWITPLRALANDTVESMRAPVQALNLPVTVELRTGDTSTALKRRQRTRMPNALVTTPESLSLLLSYPDTRAQMRSLRCVVVDEWHELLGTKRGVQTELGIARLRQWNPALRTWGMSATIGNLAQAVHTLLGPPPGATPASGAHHLVRGLNRKKVQIDTVLPTEMARFPWAGHLGLRLLPEVIAAVEQARSTLIFTNVRSSAEIWFQAIQRQRPDWIGQVAVHHGSLDRDVRTRVEEMLRQGRLRCVVCTSSLDLGVDFTPVEQVIQIGSPKGVGRLLQRAGRSGHQPGAVSRVLCVPTHALELIEFAAVRQAAAQRHIEARVPVERPLDLLVQHLVTIGLGGGFDERQLLDEVRTSHAFRGLTDQEWRWALDFVTGGGPALRAYPQYARVHSQDGRYVGKEGVIARFHRMAVGTISSEASLRVQIVGGGSLGTIEESFISRLKEGDRFVFAGRVLELARVRDMTVYVRRARQATGIVPRWYGGRMPLSTELAQAMRGKLDEARRGVEHDPEMLAVRPLLTLQGAWSRIPSPDALLVEHLKMRDGHHLYLYPFAGRLVHEGLATLLAFRLTRQEPRSIGLAANDYGFELTSPQSFPTDAEALRSVLSPENLLEDLLACVNASQLARRHFREIARIAGLIFPGFPGAGKTARQLQASSELFFDVFSEFDAGNLLLDQARREVMDRQLEVTRMRNCLAQLNSMPLDPVAIPRLTPLAFPLWADSLRAQLSSEKWSQRVQRMVLELEETADREHRQKDIPKMKQRKRSPTRVTS